MRFSTRKAGTVATLVLSIVLQGCGGFDILAGARAGFAVAKPVIQSLVDQKVIPQNVATTAIADVDDSLNAIGRAQQAVQGIPAGLTKAEAKIAKARVDFQLAQDLRSILARHHLGGNPKLDQIAAIADSVITALEAYFHQVTGDQPMARAGRAIDPDKALEAAMRKAKADMDSLK